MKRWDAFLALCEHLRTGLLGATPSGTVRDTDWTLLIEASSHHYVSPTLAWCLRGKPGLPSDVSDYLGAMLTLNARRNESLVEALHRIVATLNVAGIEPVLLKGAARLIGGDYPEQKLRFLGDIDVAIPADRSADAAAALKRAGFVDGDDGSDLGPSHHHLPALRDSATGAGVELHTELTMPLYREIIPSAWFLQNTRPAELDGLRLRLPDPTRSAAHIVVHDQLNNANYRHSRIELRQLLDLAMLRARHDGTIDWSEIDRRFCGHEQGEVLATYLDFCAQLLGQAAPKLRHPPRRDAFATFRDSIERPGRRALANLVRRRDPIGDVRKLMDAGSWSEGLRLIKAAMSRW